MMHWPVGSMTIAQTFGETIRKCFSTKLRHHLALAVGAVGVCATGVGWFDHTLWAAPLPLFAIGLMLFAHSHGGPSGRA